MITINLENVFQSDRGLYHKYSAKTSVVWEMVILGSYFPIIIWRKVLLSNFLSIFSYPTTSSSAAIVPSPPRSRTGSRPSRDRSRSSRIRSGAGSSYMSASPDYSMRRSSSDSPDCSKSSWIEDGASWRICFLETDPERGPDRVQVHLQEHVGGYHAEGGTISHWPGSGSDHSNYQLQFWM